MSTSPARTRRLGVTGILLAAVSIASCGDAGEGSPGDATAQEPSQESGDPALDLDAVDQLRALGYVDVGEPVATDAKVGVRLLDPERTAGGVNLFTNASLCTTQLMDMHGVVVHEWSYAPCFRWGNAILTPGGDLIVVGRLPHDGTPEAARAGRYLTRLDWDGGVVWERSLPAHHDVEWTPDGKVLTLTYALRDVPELHRTLPLVDNLMVLLSPDGDVLEELSLWDAMTADPDVFTMQAVRPGSFDRSKGVDALHANSVEWIRGDALRARGLEHDDDVVLVCFRHQDTVALIDWSDARVIWAWGQGELSGPHDVTMLPDGNLLLFDNGLGRGWSRVIEVDPITRKIVWEYYATDRASFFSVTRGSNQRLSNGNTLITDSDSGRTIEVSTAGEVVWEFQNFNMTPKREPSVVVRMRRFEGLDFEALAERRARAEVPNVD